MTSFFFIVEELYKIDIFFCFCIVVLSLVGAVYSGSCLRSVEFISFVLNIVDMKFPVMDYSWC
jgi:hypothetical protein